MPAHFIPKGYQHVTPYLTVNGAAEAIQFYEKAFDAKQVMRYEHNGVLGHAEIQIADCRIMIGEEMPQWGNKSPRTLGGTASGLYIYLEDVDRAFERAIRAGATQQHPVTDHFYGDRSGSLVDPFGHHWTLATHTEDVSPEELDRRFHEFMEKMAGSPEAAAAKAREHAGT